MDPKKNENERLREALIDALEGLEDMIAYVPDHYRVKWEHDTYITRAREVLGSAE